MRVGMHAEGSVPQASIVERKSKDEDDLRSHKLRLKSPIITSSGKSLSVNYKAKNGFFNGVIQAKRLFCKVF